MCGLEVVLIVYDLLECFYTSSSDAKSWFPLFSMLSSRPHWQSFAGESYSFSEREHYWIDTSGVFLLLWNTGPDLQGNDWEAFL